MIKHFGNKHGFEPLMTIMIVFTLCVVGTITFKTRHVGRELYPESAYPYQGKIMIGTNAVPEPKW